MAETNGHYLEVASFTKPTWCKNCGDFMKGLKDQGFKCQNCEQKFCKDCERSGCGQCPTVVAARKGHYLEVASFKKPTWCDNCEDFMAGLKDQGFRCNICERQFCKKCAHSDCGQCPKACVNGCGRPRFGSFKTCCKGCKGMDGPHAQSCIENAPAHVYNHEEPSCLANAACGNGCGRARFGTFKTCCNHCKGVDGPHARDCDEKAGLEKVADSRPSVAGGYTAGGNPQISGNSAIKGALPQTFDELVEEVQRRGLIAHGELIYPVENVTTRSSRLTHYQFHEEIDHAPKILPDVARGKWTSNNFKTIREIDSVPRCEVLPATFGQNAAYMARQFYPDAKIGVMVAGNSGLPLGGMSKDPKWCYPTGIAIGTPNADYHTQEEDMVSSWLQAETWQKTGRENDQEAINHLYQQTVMGQWGLADMRDWHSLKSIQGVDYINGSCKVFGDSWILRDAFIAPKLIGSSGKYFDFESPVRVELVFIAGPNADFGTPPVPAEGGRWKPPVVIQNRMPALSINTCGRTLNQEAKQEGEDTQFANFVEGIKNALRAGFDGMIAEGIQVAIVAGVSTGIYAGSLGSARRTFIDANFQRLVNEVLDEEITHNKSAQGGGGEMSLRARFFQSVWWPQLEGGNPCLTKDAFYLLTANKESIVKAYPMLWKDLKRLA